VDIGSLDAVLVRTILEHASDFEWAYQDIGLLGLRLDERREYRMHVWAPGRGTGSPVIHDHPFDFVSRVVAGELTNVRYVEDPSGASYVRDRYTPPDEDNRTTDVVRLAGAAETYRAGDEYAQQAHELHDSRQLPGTVTILRRRFREIEELTVCRIAGTPWVTGASRAATPDEVKEITSAALEWF